MTTFPPGTEFQMPQLSFSRLESMVEPDERLPLAFRASLRVGCIDNENPRVVGIPIMLNLEILQKRKPTKRNPAAEVRLAEVESFYAAMAKWPEGQAAPREDKDLEELALGAASDLVFPHLQEAISDITRRMGYPPLVLGRSDIELSLFREPLED